jgi:copper chaperone NosL
MNNRLSLSTKIIAILSAIALIIVIFVPIWRIELSAPQYPEGLVMQIYSNHLAGDVQIINGLNHYIGMRELHVDDFVEFQVLPYIIGALGLFGLVAAAVNRKWFFYTWAICFFVFAFASMIDFYIWEYNYGHNLDPAAPIKVPGMTYQPPLIGFKQLLNFGAYSIPDIGGWMLVSVGVALLYGFIREIMDYKKQKLKLNSLLVATLLIPAFFFSSCSTGPQAINFGVDNCDYCVMTIVDEHFGAEVVTNKGKAYKFDDLHCLNKFLEEEQVLEKDIKEIYYIDFSKPTSFITASNALLLQGDDIKSPMASNIATFEEVDSLKKYQEYFNAKEIQWEDYKNN